MVHLGVLLHLIHQLYRTLRVPFTDVRLRDPARRRYASKVLLQLPIIIIFVIILVIVTIGIVHLFTSFLEVVILLTALAKFTVILGLWLL